MGIITTSFSALCGNRAPLAKADSNWVQEDLSGTASGNVLKSISHNVPQPPTGTFADVADSDADGQTLKVTTTGTFNLKYGILVLKADGSYTYTLYTAAQNLAAYKAVQKLTSGETLKENSFAYGVTDGALSASSTLNLTVFGSNDPVNIGGIGLTGGDQTVFENDLANGTSPNAPALTKTGIFTFVATDGIDDLKVGGTFVVENGLVKNLNTAIVTANGIIKVTSVNIATGTVAYTYTLTKAATHAAGGGDNSVTSPLFDKISVSLTDRDGSAKASTINVKVIDDAPVGKAVVDADVLDDEGLAGGIAGGTGDAAGALTSTTGSLGYVAGADGFQSVVLTGPATLGAEAVTSSWNTATSTLTISSAARGTIATVTITNLATGAYNVKLLQPVLHSAGGGENDAILNVTYKVTDKDGDSASGSLKVTIDDDSPKGANVVDADILDDEGLAGGIAGGTGDVAGALTSTTGSLGYTAGADGLKSLVLTGPATLGTEAVTSSWNTATSTLSISSAARGVIATVEITNLASGAYTVTLLKPVLHASGGGENDAILNVAYTITDKDNDSANGSLKVTIDDDTPTIGFSNQDLGFPALFVDDTDLTTDAVNTVNPALYAVSPGADGLASLLFTLDVKSPGVLSGLADTATKTDIVLTLEASAVFGRVGPGGTIAFKLSINSTTGQVTLDQRRAVVHDFNPDQNDLKGLINDSVKLIATATDKDGDKASTSLDIGGNLLFLDDGPTATNDGNLATNAENVSNLNIGTLAGLLGNDDFGADGQAATTPISIGAGSNGGTINIGAGGTLLYTNTTANPGPGSPIVETFTYTIKDGDGDTTTATFTVTLTDTGPSITAAPTNSLVDEDNLPVIGNNDNALGDDPQVLTGTISYTLANDPLGSIALNVVATGLLKLDGVTQVNTIWNAGTNTLTGYGGANQADVVFTIQLSAIGTATNAANTATYTVTLFQPVRHPGQDNPSTPDVIETAFEDNAGFTVDVTVTDNDGSTATTSFGVQIDDDTPKQPVLTVNTSPPLSHDETPCNNLPGSNDTDGTTLVSFNGANVQIATLFAALPLADDPHVPGPGPIGYASGALPVTVTGAAAFGADGPATTNSAVYSLDIPDPLGTDSGVSTTEGTKIFLFKLADSTIVGRVGNELPGGDTANSAGAIAFALRVDPSSATLNMVQYLSLLHPTPGNFDESIPLSLTALQLKLALTDKDNDVATGTINVGSSVTFQDDGPRQITPDHAVLSISASGPVFTGQLDIDGNVDPNYGADGGTVRFLSDLSGQNSGLTSNGQPISYFIDPLTPHILQGKVGAAVIFTITLNFDGDGTLSNDTYSIDIQGVVDGPKQTSTFVPESGNFQGGNDPWAGFFDNTNNDSRDLLLTPIGNNSINTTANSAGVGGGASIGTGEAMRIDSVRDLTGDVSSSDPGGYTDVDNRDHVFEQHLNTNGLTVTIGGINAASTSDIRLKAFDDPGGDKVPVLNYDIVGTGNTQLSVTAVTLFFNGVSVVVSQSVIGTGVTYAVPAAGIGGHAGFTVTFQDIGGGILEAVVGGAVNTLKIGTTTALGYDSLEVWHDDGDTFQIRELGSTVIDPAKPVNFSVPIQIVDGDNDALLSSIGITLAPAGDDYVHGSGAVYLASHIENARGSNGTDIISGNGLNNIIYGDAGGDTIEGGGGNDLLIGGLGTDQLTGSGGNDVFMFSNAADSPTQASADRITDFDGDPAGGQDIIDLSLIDANTATLLANNAFLFAGANANVVANSISYEVLVNTDIVIRGDVNGDTIADLVILLTDNGSIPPLTAADFIL